MRLVGPGHARNSCISTDAHFTMQPAGCVVVSHVQFRNRVKDQSGRPCCPKMRGATAGAWLPALRLPANRLDELWVQQRHVMPNNGVSQHGCRNPLEQKNLRRWERRFGSLRQPPAIWHWLAARHFPFFVKINGESFTISQYYGGTSHFANIRAWSV